MKLRVPLFALALLVLLIPSPSGIALADDDSDKNCRVIWAQLITSMF